jgi:CRISPR-associated endonuclease/helicase Cas3
VLAQIKARLADPAAAVRVIATQLVEAGVDLDFPAVFRAMAGLDSIAQAAGRCNREGSLHEGRVIVFRAPLDPPDGVLRVAAQVALPMLERGDGDPLTHDAFERFFRQLYWTQGERLDSRQIVSGPSALLARRDLSYAFRTAAEQFRIIPDEQVPVVMPWGDASRLVAEIARLGISRDRLRGIQRYIVGVYRKTLTRLSDAAAVREVAPGLFVLERKPLYSSATGLDDRGAGYFDPEELMA